VAALLPLTDAEAAASESSVVEFEDVHVLAPRGRMVVDMHASYFRMSGQVGHTGCEEGQEVFDGGGGGRSRVGGWGCSQASCLCMSGQVGHTRSCFETGVYVRELGTNRCRMLKM
jgi:hypothetical protein